jgi:hypothetical protein
MVWAGYGAGLTMRRSAIDVRMSEIELGGMLAASDWEQLSRQVLALLLGTGISDFFIRIEVDVGDGSTCSHCFGSLPGAVLQSFAANLKGQDDVVNRHIARSGLPLAWHTESLCGGAGGQPYAMLRARGICEGISVTARDALAVSRVDFYRQAASGHGLSTALTADLMLLGSYLHEAMRLRLSHHTGEFPLKNAARKFNVYSTRHAINRATRLGMIKPLSSAHG